MFHVQLRAARYGQTITIAILLLYDGCDALKLKIFSVIKKAVNCFKCYIHSMHTDSPYLENKMQNRPFFCDVTKAVPTLKYCFNSFTYFSAFLSPSTCTLELHDMHIAAFYDISTEDTYVTITIWRQYIVHF